MKSKKRVVLSILVAALGVAMSVVYFSNVAKDIRSQRLSERNRQELEVLRMPVVSRTEKTEQTIIPKNERPPVVGAAYTPDNDKSPYALDEWTLANYETLKAKYPDFKGWIELPGWDISYPIFTNETNPLKYERMTRDGQFSYLGEVNYQGDPLTSSNLIIFGHSLTDRSGFSKIDVLPDQLNSVSEDKRQIWLDLTATGERREYKIVSSKYFPRSDESWMQYDFSSIDEYRAYLENVAGIHDYTGAIITLATCKNAKGDIKAVSFAIPND